MPKQIRTDAETFARLTDPARGMSDAEVLAELEKERDRDEPDIWSECADCGQRYDPDFPHEHEGRTEKRAGGRIKRTLVRDPAVGVTFGSMVEARRYDWLIAQPDVVHVDVHPIFSLPKGERYHADFLVHRLSSGCGIHAWVEDVKGRTPSTDFNRTRALFDSSHPLAPLRVVVWRKGEWREI